MEVLVLGTIRGRGQGKGEIGLEWYQLMLSLCMDGVMSASTSVLFLVGFFFYSSSSASSDLYHHHNFGNNDLDSEGRLSIHSHRRELPKPPF